MLKCGIWPAAEYRVKTWTMFPWRDLILNCSGIRRKSSMAGIKIKAPHDKICLEINPFLALSLIAWIFSSAGGQKWHKRDVENEETKSVFSHLFREHGDVVEVSVTSVSDRHYEENPAQVLWEQRLLTLWGKNGEAKHFQHECFLVSYLSVDVSGWFLW